jgi:hypothetical protein
VENISKIRHALADIPGCLRPFPPDETFKGSGPGVQCIEMNSGIGREEENVSFLPPENENYLISYNFEEFQPHFEIGSEIDPASPLFDGELGQRLKQSTLIQGIDAYGWYSSFHQTGVQWGVYISLTYMRYFMHDTLKSLQVSTMTKAEIAFNCILNHELFHFATDYAIAQAELFSTEAWWWPMHEAKNPHHNIQEEKLANAYMLQSCERTKSEFKIKGKKESIKNFTKLQPPGYCDAVSVKRNDWKRELALLAHEYGKHTEEMKNNYILWSDKFGFDWARFFPISPQIDWRFCPIFLVDDTKKYGVNSGWLEYLTSIPLIEENFSFQNQLSKLGQNIRKAWDRTKFRLQQQITPGADFKKWPPGGDNVYSVRINDNFRAHLKGVPGDKNWVAIGIGSHKNMGHG